MPLAVKMGLGLPILAARRAASGDTTAPTLSSVSPANGATGVSVTTDLVMTFDETVQLGSSGTVQLYTAGGSLVESWDVATDGGSGAGQIAASGSTVTAKLTSSLALQTGYYVLADGGAIKDLAGNSWAGIASTSAWVWTTVTDYLAAWIGAATYADWWARVTSTLYQDSSGTTPVTASGDKVGRWNSRVGAVYGSNSTASQRLNYLITAGRYTLTADGLDDNLLTSWTAASGGNTILFDIDVQVSLPAIQIFFGYSSTTTDRFRLSINTDGKLCAGVGGQSESTIVGTTDWRGQRCVGGLSFDGTTVRLFTLSGGQEYSAAQSGSPSTTGAARIAALNAGGSVSNAFSGGIARIVPVKQGGLTLSDWLNIGPQFAAGLSLAA